MLLTEHQLEFLSLKGGCTGSFESTLVKMPHCWKSQVTAQILFLPAHVIRGYLSIEPFLTFCMLGNFSCFCCFLLIFLFFDFSKNSLWNTISVSISLDPDKDQCSIGPDLGPNCLQWLSAENKSCLQCICHGINRPPDKNV